MRDRRAYMAGVPDELLRRAGTDGALYELLKGLGPRSAIVVPIEGGGAETLGVITFVTAESGRVFKEQDLVVAEELARRAGVALVNSRQYEQRSAVAHTLQQALIPSDLPEIPGWQLSSLYYPAVEGTEVGGDFYDAFPIPGGWMLVIGDVCGRGTDAASVTALARHTLRAAGALSGDMVTAIAQLNGWLLERGRGGICTVLTIVLRDWGEAEIVSAGHPPPLLIRGLEVLPLEERGPMLGFMPEASWPVQRVQLEPGDQLVLYTDGVTELAGEAERFGEERLRATVSGARSPDAVLERVRAAHEAFSERPPEDDLAMLTVMRTAATEPAAPRLAASSRVA
jgi:serine phosphatase RsbU (regulator of sigma subunit)